MKEVWDEGYWTTDFELNSNDLEEDSSSMDIFMDLAPERLSKRTVDGRFSKARTTAGARMRGRQTQRTVPASFKNIPPMERTIATSPSPSAVRLDTGGRVLSAALLKRLGRSEHGVACVEKQPKVATGAHQPHIPQASTTNQPEGDLKPTSLRACAF